ncbi:MAG TPA: magnesium-translocating P-type ATPase [Ktedonobacterales bacterium]|nr:magnesium-translocating P-type ATPase [Ktedonobacterales bacterium]
MRKALRNHPHVAASKPGLQALQNTNNIAAVFERLHATASGLSAQEAQHRLALYGPNAPAPARRFATIRQFLSFLLNPLVIILLVASIISAILGEQLNAAIIAVLVLLSVVINFVQAYRSEQAADQLRAQVTPTATVLRDGQWIQLQRRDLVTGDVIQLAAGDLVPADARLIQARDLHVQQSALTGESLPVEKDAADVAAPTPSLTDAPYMVLQGTSVISGTATAVVTATGRATAFGDVVARLAARPPEMEFDRGIRRFSYLIMRTVIFLVLFVLVINIAFHRPALESLLFAVALAVGLTPEFLPMITTVTLGQGALRMAKHKVIVKQLPAIQNFGSMDILCSDKTGTLTTGEMTLDQWVNPLGVVSERVLLLAQLNSLYDTGIKSPLDVALLRHEQPDVSDYYKLDELPFDFERRRLSVAVEHKDECLLITKGAPEGILEVCACYEEDGIEQPLGVDVRKRCETTYQRLSAQGYRTLAVAYRRVPAQHQYQLTDEAEMTLAGYVAFFDPPVAGAHEVLESLRRDGIEVKILTGDNDLVAAHICGQVGLDASRIVLGDDLDHMSDTALQHVAEQSTIFARVSPAQKNRIILALKARRHVVGFLGDGINDAPSLHVADVGISVAGAVDVAKDAAAIIMMERSLEVLQQGVIEGRKAFGNVMKYLLMGTSSNFGNMFSMAAAALFLPFLPMLPTQILLNNFLYDLSQVTIPTDNVDATYVEKPHRWNISLIRNFMIFIGPISSVFDFLTFWVMLAIFHASEALFHTGWFVESLATQTLVLFIIRTGGNPLRSRPSRPLTVTTLLIVLVGVLLPFSPLAPALGFTPLPLLYFLFLILAIAVYLTLVEIVKRWLMRRSHE